MSRDLVELRLVASEKAEVVPLWCRGDVCKVAIMRMNEANSLNAAAVAVACEI